MKTNTQKLNGLTDNKVRGFICLCSSSGGIAECKRYVSKGTRKAIITNWTKKYKLKPGNHMFLMQPDFEEKKVSGFISLFVEEKLVTEVKFDDCYERQEIINEWEKKYHLKNVSHFINIKPNETKD